MAETRELNIDSLVGPTHNYAGLSFGNVASSKHAMTRSNPKQAALQGLAKMKFLHDLGVAQAVLPPHPRPDLGALRRLGFSGNDADLLLSAYRYDPRLLAAVYSASAMWAANAATVSPSPETADARVHFTPANLITQFHRSLEPPVTGGYLKQIFSDPKFFAHHAPLPATDAFADEGAANHLRLCDEYGNPGIEVFIYGRDGDQASSHFPARQTRSACEALARLHQLSPQRTVLARQNPVAIDAGVFHNDVIAVSNQNVLICHASAWCDGERILDEIRHKFAAVSGKDLWVFSASDDQISLTDAVASYVFNSQLITLPDGTMSLIAPVECEENPGVRDFIGRILARNGPVRSVHYLDVRQSMKNGGGPACLRLRVTLSDGQLAAVFPGVMFTQSLHDRLAGWIEKFYRDSLLPEDLPDPLLLREVRDAMDELNKLVGFSIRPAQ